MARIYKLIYPASLLVQVRSRECCTYLFRVMMYIGWLPPKEGIRRYIYFIWTFLFYTMASLYVPMGLGLSLIIDFKRFTPGEFLVVLELFSNIFGALVKSIIVIIFIQRLHDTQPLLDDLDKRVQSVSDREKVHKGVAASNYILLVYGKVFLVYLLSDNIAGVVNAQPPWMMYNPMFDWRNGKCELWMQSLLEYIVMMMVSSVILILDTYTIVFVNIFRTHIDILKDHIRNLRTEPSKTEAESYDELVSCITYHQSILNCCNMIRPIVTRTILVQFMLIGVVLGLTFINVLYFAGIFRAVSSILFVAALLIETFPFCYFCDLLAEDASELANLLAQSNWIDAEKRYKTTLRLFMLYVQKPITFLAGGLFPISLNSNIKMAKFAFTVMTLVQKMNLADRFK